MSHKPKIVGWIVDAAITLLLLAVIFVGFRAGQVVVWLWKVTP